ncbi:DsbA family protein [Paenibacillus donghaensis]|uniref:Disulfide dehydrogenase n=1 Tax=Paenibacillus donghaensis TaxID=414771 RepID=A0A2Z2K8R6_9BACL|nr:thioredoxin domain-containing protein [Paenibacillus donghaensis]ASA21754.1 disulfide dehydrogenase [Paenibacillus donghaensis]
MSKTKKPQVQAPQKSKQEIRRAQQEQAKQKTRLLIIGSVAVVVILFVALFMLTSRDKVTSFNYDEMPRLGSADAPVKIVEFGDYKCPACSQFAGLIKPQLVQDYIDQGKASFHFVNMAFIATDSTTASLAALSVYHQDNEAFWKYYDALYANQGAEDVEWATADYLVELAKQLDLGIDLELLRKDIDEHTYVDELDRDIELAKDKKVSSTPTLFINGVKSDKAFDAAALSAQIDAALEKAGTK